MLAKILGVVLLIWGGVLAFKLIFPVIGGIFGMITVVAIALLAAGALYMGKRWINGESILGRVIGALALIAGAILAFKAAFFITTYSAGLREAHNLTHTKVKTLLPLLTMTSQPL